MTEQEKKQAVAESFAANAKLNALYQTADGQCFSNDHTARTHQRTLGVIDEPTQHKRSDKDAEKEAAAKAAAAAKKVDEQAAEQAAQDAQAAAEKAAAETKTATAPAAKPKIVRKPAAKKTA